MMTSVIATPYGKKYFVNADFTATGTSYYPIQKYMNNRILPYYSNVHSNAHNGRLMAHFVNQSKELIRASIGAKPCDKIIFTGNGCSGAVIHLIHSLNLRQRTSPKTTVFLSVGEHHSNYLPWTHLPVDLKVIPFKEDGILDLKELKRELALCKGPIIGSFIAGSNVTGVIQPVYAIAKMVHRAGGLVFLDFAASAPYVPISMHGDRDGDPDTYFDAIFVSPHKFLGGQGTPGLLVANNKLFRNDIPFCPGGGTVRFVCKKFKHYADDPERRETGGTPQILGCIRAGLVFQLKDEKIRFIVRRNAAIHRRVLPILEAIPGIRLINPHSSCGVEQFPIYSFILPNVHYNLVVVLLNDLFGIQSRGGVSCCSVYAEHLLHMDKSKRDKIYHQIISNKGVPGDYGWTRVSFHYTMSDDVIDYIIYAIKYVAANADKYEMDYTYEPVSNIWKHKVHPCDKFPALDFHSNNRLPNTDMPLTAKLLKKNLSGLR